MILSKSHPEIDLLDNSLITSEITNKWKEGRPENLPVLLDIAILLSDNKSFKNNIVT